MRQVKRAELEAKASKSAGEIDDEKKTPGEPQGDDVTIDDTSFLINLIDSPGHVDFSSEVKKMFRSLLT